MSESFTQSIHSQTQTFSEIMVCFDSYLMPIQIIFLINV